MNVENNVEHFSQDIRSFCEHLKNVEIKSIQFSLGPGCPLRKKTVNASFRVYWRGGGSISGVGLAVARYHQCSDVDSIHRNQSIRLDDIPSIHPLAPLVDKSSM